MLKASEELSECIWPAVEGVKKQLSKADVVNLDESGLRVKGALYWLHVTSTEQATHYEVHAKRGKEAMDGMISKAKQSMTIGSLILSTRQSKVL